MIFIEEKIHYASRVRTLNFNFCFYYPRSRINFQEQKRIPGAQKEKMAKLRLPIILDSHKMKLSENIILSIF